MAELPIEHANAEQAHILRVGQCRQGAQGKVPGRINECPFLRGQRRRVGSIDIGKQAENVECAEGKRHHDVIPLRRMPEEYNRGVEEVGERMFVM